MPLAAPDELSEDPAVIVEPVTAGTAGELLLTTSEMIADEFVGDPPAPVDCVFELPVPVDSVDSVVLGPSEVGKYEPRTDVSVSTGKISELPYPETEEVQESPRYGLETVEVETSGVGA